MKGCCSGPYPGAAWSNHDRSRRGRPLHQDDRTTSVESDGHGFRVGPPRTPRRAPAFTGCTLIAQEEGSGGHSRGSRVWNRVGEDHFGRGGVDGHGRHDRRGRLRADGTGRRGRWQLVSRCVPGRCGRGRDDGVLLRVPVEQLPVGRRDREVPDRGVRRRPGRWNVHDGDVGVDGAEREPRREDVRDLLHAARRNEHRDGLGRRSRRCVADRLVRDQRGGQSRSEHRRAPRRRCR